MRLFAAVWPPADVLDHLDLALASVRGAPAGTSSAVRWSARENWHLTVAFYGDLPDGAVPGLAADLADLAAGIEPYELALRGAGVFSHRTLWVGVGGDLETQRAVTHGCVEAGESAGGVTDNRPRDRPHLTVGRVRPGSRPPRRRSSGPDRPGQRPDMHGGGGRRRSEPRAGAGCLRGAALDRRRAGPHVVAAGRRARWGTAVRADRHLCAGAVAAVVASWRP